MVSRQAWVSDSQFFYCRCTATLSLGKPSLGSVRHHSGVAESIYLKCSKGVQSLQSSSYCTLLFLLSCSVSNSSSGNRLALFSPSSAIRRQLEKQYKNTFLKTQDFTPVVFPNLCQYFITYHAISANYLVQFGRFSPDKIPLNTTLEHIQKGQKFQNIRPVSNNYL